MKTEKAVIVTEHIETSNGRAIWRGSGLRVMGWDGENPIVVPRNEGRFGCQTIPAESWRTYDEHMLVVLRYLSPRLDPALRAVVDTAIEAIERGESESVRWAAAPAERPASLIGAMTGANQRNDCWGVILDLGVHKEPTLDDQIRAALGRLIKEISAGYAETVADAGHLIIQLLAYPPMTEEEADAYRCGNATVRAAFDAQDEERQAAWATACAEYRAAIKCGEPF